MSAPGPTLAEAIAAAHNDWCKRKPGGLWRDHMAAAVREYFGILKAEDWKRFMDAVDNPKPVTPYMREAVRMYLKNRDKGGNRE
jgi:hypothetical protein